MKKHIDNGQLNIFDLIQEVSRKQAATCSAPATAGKASIDAAVRHLISSGLKQSALGRYEVAARMSETLGVEITKAQLDSWSAESKEQHRFPIVYTGAFCHATGCRALVRYMAELCGGFYIEGEDAIRLELGKLEEQKERIAEREKAIREFLHGR